MTTILSRKDLRHQRDRYIMVQREDAIYLRVDDEYVRKQYFTVQEAGQILFPDWETRNTTRRNDVHQLCIKLGIQARANKRKKIRISFKQLRKMADLL